LPSRIDSGQTLVTLEGALWVSRKTENAHVGSDARKPAGSAARSHLLVLLQFHSDGIDTVPLS